MDLSSDLRQQLMTLTGITDPSEFADILKEFGPQIQRAKADAGLSSSNNYPEATNKFNEKCPFQSHLLHMIGLVEAEGIVKFTSLNGQIEKQIQYVFDILNADATCQDVSNLVKPKKEEEDEVPDLMTQSTRLRDQGNNFFGKKSFDSALKLYTESLLLGPLDQMGQGREVAVSLGNRSALFFQQKKFWKCLDDIEAAFLFGYPLDMRYKLLDRQGRCFVALKDLKRAQELFKEAIEAVKESQLDLSRQEQVIAELKKLLSEAEKGSKTSIPAKRTERDTCPFQIWDRHKHFPSLSDSLEIVFSPETGRHVRAVSSIRAGEAIVIEEPIAFHLSPYKMTTNCLHCFRVLGETVLPSPWIKKARFCGLACLKVAMSTYLPTEGAFDITQIFYGDTQDESQLSGCISLAYRAMTQKSLAFFKAKATKLFQDHDLKFGTEVAPDFSYHGDQIYRGLFNLVTHLDQALAQERLTFIIRTFVLFKCLQKAKYFPTESLSSNDEGLTRDEMLVAKLLFHFQFGIRYNLHSIYQTEERIEAGKKIPLVDIGSGVYPTTLFFNHSCAPNTVRINMGPKVAYVAKRNIKAGEEVTDCYGIHHLSMDKAKRQRTLKAGYAFDCCCQGCQRDYQLLQHLPGTLKPPMAQKLGTLMSKYKSLFESGKTKEALRVCQDYLVKLEDLGLAFPHRNYEVAAMALCSCLWQLVRNY